MCIVARYQINLGQHAGDTALFQDSLNTLFGIEATLPNRFARLNRSLRQKKLLTRAKQRGVAVVAAAVVVGVAKTQ